VNRLGRALVPVGWVLLLPVPFLVFWGVGLIHISRSHGALVEHGVLHDTTSPGVWAALAVVYLVWVLSLTVASIWLLDRLGYHYQPYDRPRRPTRKERRRRRAGLKYQQARQEADRAALREIARDSKRAARDTDADAHEGPAHDAANEGGNERR
jgi:hypothetical protein